MQKRKKKVNDDQRSRDKLSGKQIQVDVIWFRFLQSFVVSVFRRANSTWWVKPIYGRMTVEHRLASIWVAQSAAAEFSILLTCVWPHLFHFFFFWHF